MALAAKDSEVTALKGRLAALAAGGEWVAADRAPELKSATVNAQESGVLQGRVVLLQVLVFAVCVYAGPWIVAGYYNHLSNRVGFPCEFTMVTA